MIFPLLMLLQVILAVEALRAARAMEKIFAGVQLQVDVVVAFVEELLAATRAGEDVLRRVARPVERHRVVAFELLLADGAGKLLVGILVPRHVRLEAILLEAGITAVGDGTLEGLPQSMLLRHVTEFGGTMDENGVALVARPDLIGVEEADVLAQAELVLEGLLADAADRRRFVAFLRFLQRIHTVLRMSLRVVRRPLDAFRAAFIDTDVSRAEMPLECVLALEVEQADGAREELLRRVDHLATHLLVLLPVVATVELLGAARTFEPQTDAVNLRLMRDFRPPRAERFGAASARHVRFSRRVDRREMFEERSAVLEGLRAHAKDGKIQLGFHLVDRLFCFAIADARFALHVLRFALRLLESTDLKFGFRIIRNVVFFDELRVVVQRKQIFIVRLDRLHHQIIIVFLVKLLDDNFLIICVVYWFGSRLVFFLKLQLVNLHHKLRFIHLQPLLDALDSHPKVVIRNQVQLAVVADFLWQLRMVADRISGVSFVDFRISLGSDGAVEHRF